MPLNNMGLGFTFTARNLASGTIGRLRGQLNGLGSRGAAAGVAMRAGFTAAAAGIVPLAAGLGTLSSAMNLANAAGEFQQGLAAVGAVTRASEEDLVNLREAAIQAGIDTQFSPTEAIEGLNSLATAGQTATQATQSLIPALQLAAGSNGQLGVAAASEAVVGTLNAYSLSADEAASVTDRLVRITQLSNFQARDFSAGLSKAAASGAVFGQSMNDTLITMGLLRNANIDASSSATAFREATRRLGSDQRAQQTIQSAGVRVFDEQTGAMRQLPDILLDLADRTADMTEQERNRTVAQALGARGLLAFNAVANAQATVMRDGREVTLRGADAIAHMRAEMEAATGTAEDFQNQLLDTFEGQKTLLEGTLQTFAVVLGEPFARVFKPIVGAVVDGLNFLLQAFNNLPDGMKDMIANIVVAGGVFSTLVGVVSILTGLFIVLLPFLKVIAASLLVGMGALLPFVLAVGGAIAAVFAFRAALEDDLGGVGTFFVQTFNRIKLAFQAITQLFSDGGFSGEVREEMNRAENLGIRKFAINVFRIGSRIMEFFSGIGRGFAAGLEILGPTFERFVGALRELGEAFGFVDDAADGLASTPMDDFATTGARLGEFFVDVLGFVVEAITRVVNFWTGFVDGFKETTKEFQPVFDEVGAAFSALGDAIGEFFGAFDTNAEGGNDTVRSFGEIVGSVFANVVRIFAQMISAAVRMVTFVVNIFNRMEGAIQSLVAFFFRLKIVVATVFANVVDSVKNSLDTVLAFIGRIVSRVPAAVRPAFANDIIQAGQEAEGRVAGRNIQQQARTAGAGAQLRAITNLQTAQQDSAAVRDTGREDRVSEVAALLREERSNRRRAASGESTQVIVQIDGQAVATAVAGANRTESARGFVPGVASDT